MLTHPLTGRIRQGEDLNRTKRMDAAANAIAIAIKIGAFVVAMLVAWVIIGGAA